MSMAIDQIEVAEAVEEQLGCPDNVVVRVGIDDDGDAFVSVQVDPSCLSGNEVDQLAEGLEAVCKEHTIQLHITGEPADISYLFQAFATAGGEWGLVQFWADGCAGPLMPTDD